jgi:TetR/AcrR family transcriptional regulator
MELNDLQPVSAPTAVKIMNAAGHLFLQRGYKAVSINDIITAAEVTKPTLYYYFADKEELFVQMGLGVLADMGERLGRVLQGFASTAYRLEALANVLMDDRDTDMRLMRHEMLAHLGPTQRARLSRAFYLHMFAPIVHVMEQGLASGDLAHYSAISLAKMFMGMAESFQEFAHLPAAAADARHDAFFEPSDLSSKVLVDLFLHGVSNVDRASSRGITPTALHK